MSYLTEELVRLGHEVTLFASADSVTSAELAPCAPAGLRFAAGVRDPLPYHVLQLERVRRRAAEFDVLHFHVDALHLPLFRRTPSRSVTTLHGRLDAPEVVELYVEFADLPLVSISDAQRHPIPGANWAATVHHGLPRHLCRCDARPRPRDYLAFLGRCSREKGLDAAIEIARRAGVPLRIAAKVDPADERYFHEVIVPLLRGPGVEFAGEIDEAGKEAFLGGARALLFPIDWPEPFGLAMIEAMSCGTPVIAFPRGSVREVVDHGVTGLVVSSIEEAVAAVDAAAGLDRARVRRRFEQRFTAERMARRYLEVYVRAEECAA